MPQFEFTPARIDQYTIGIGVDVRPPIELALDKLRIQEFYNQVSDQFPNLFADLSQSKTKFQINKEIPTPDQGQISIATFTLTPRGPVFNFPITLPELLEDHEWSKTLNEDVVACLATFHRHLPGTQFFRIGKVRNIVFHCEGADGSEVFRERFCPHAPKGSQDFVVGWNDPDERYNRRLTTKAVRKQRLVSQEVGGTTRPVLVPQGEHGIEVAFDVNNLRQDKPLDGEQMKIILDHADQLYKEYFYDVLNEGKR